MNSEEEFYDAETGMPIELNTVHDVIEIWGVNKLPVKNAFFGKTPFLMKEIVLFM